MKKLLYSSFLTIFVLTACEPVPHYNRTTVVGLTGQRVDIPSSKHGKIKPYGSVKLYQSKDEVPGKYDIIALMSVEGKAGEEAMFINAFLHRAADIDADAIIFYRGDTMSAMSGMAAAGRTGGFGFIESHQDGIFRAEAIRLK